MHRAKRFLHKYGEDILNFMGKHADHITPDKVTFLAAMCDDYEKICGCVEFHRDHLSGELYGHDHMRHRGADSMMDHDETPWESSEHNGAWESAMESMPQNPRRGRRR